jgi:hypothetical protein
MGKRRKAALVLILVEMTVAPLSYAQDASCDAATRYVMPNDVETSKTTPGVAPADLPGSRSGYTLPRKMVMNLAINPLGPAFDETRMPLGRVEIDRRTGETTLDGKPLDGGQGAKAACATAQPEPNPAKPNPAKPAQPRRDSP